MKNLSLVHTAHRCAMAILFSAGVLTVAITSSVSGTDLLCICSIETSQCRFRNFRPGF